MVFGRILTVGLIDEVGPSEEVVQLHYVRIYQYLCEMCARGTASNKVDESW